MINKIQKSDTFKTLFSSESVSEGHPDKICDIISDAILDECLRQDPYSRVACECYITKGVLIIGGEITTNAVVDYEQVARDVMKDIGYDNSRLGLNYKTCHIKVLLKKQSLEISKGVDNNGAGDQGMMYGYACKETDNYMPLGIVLAHELVKRATALRKSGEFKHARPDMKAQVTINYSPLGNSLDSIVMSIQQDSKIQYKEFDRYVINNIIEPVVNEYGLSLKGVKVFINPAGRWHLGGPAADVGLTGRKLIVDTYGGYARHGGGSFSGKDATKVDRSAAYMARYIAKNIVAADLADVCEVQLAYVIGKPEPASVHIDTFGTNKVNEKKILQAVFATFKLTPQDIIEQLDLRKPQYRALAAYGHIGRKDIDTNWEHLDKVEELKNFIKSSKN